MWVQPGHGVHGMRQPVLAWLGNWSAARRHGNRGRRLHALLWGLVRADTLAGLLGASWRAAAAALMLTCSIKGTSE